MSAADRAGGGARWLLPVIYLGFISIGLPDGAFGVAWPRMHRDLHVRVELAGTMLVFVTLLSAASSLASGTLLGRFGTGRVVFASCLLTAGAQWIVSQAQGLGWLVAAALPLGLGAGAVDAGLNGHVARHYSGRHMNWLHAAWGLGATGGPLLVNWAITHQGSWRPGYLIAAIFQTLLALLFLATLGAWPRPAGTPGHSSNSSNPGVRFGPATANSAAGFLSVGAFGLYVASETTLGLWAGSVLVVSRGLSQETAGAGVAAYFGAITAGRVLVGFVADRWGNRRLIRAGLLLALIGTLLLAVSPGGVLPCLALALAGLGLAPVYPSLMHETPRRFTALAAPVVIGRQTSAAYLGAAVLSPAVGALARVTSLESACWMAAGGVLALLLVVGRLDRISQT
ncbi:MAG: MFS transporter [Verrucomicrobiota bacterium]